MIDEILEYTEKIGKLFATFKISLILGAIINIVIIYILFKMTDMLMNKLNNKLGKNTNLPLNQIIPVLAKVIKFFIAFIIIASFLQSQGYSLTSLIAGFGITGLAVGFAAQQTIASMFGTVSILSDKVYKLGDYIKVNGVEGYVEKISLRSTKIRTLDNFLITIPNDICADTIIENVSVANKRKLDISIGVTYDTPNEKLQEAMDIIKEVITARSDVHKDFHIFIDKLDNSSINVRLYAYIKTKSYFTLIEIRGKIYQEIIKRYRAAGIEFAFPSQTIYMAKDED